MCVLAFLPSFLPGLLECLVPFSAYAKKQPNLGWPQLVVQLEGEALGGLYPRQIPGR